MSKTSPEAERSDVHPCWSEGGPEEGGSFVMVILRSRELYDDLTSDIITLEASSGKHGVIT